MLCAAWLAEGTPARAGERQTLQGHVPPAVGRLPALERLASTNRLELVIGLPLRNREALAGLLGQLYDPASRGYRQYLTPGEFAERFGPTPEDYEAVIAYAKANSLRVTGTHPNRTLVDMSGAVGDIEKTFQVRLHVYQHPTEGRTFYAPDVEPSLDLAVPVLAVSGLDNYALPRPASQAAFSFRKISEAAPNAEPWGTGAGPRGTFIGRDFRAAYAPGVGLDGAGQAVGLLEFDGYFTSDVLAYENLAGLPNVTVTNVLVDGFSGQPGGNNVEVALDIDMAICMAPGLSRVIVYEAAPGSNPYDLLNRMATDTNNLGQPVARQLSSSWSWPASPTAAQEQIFQQLAAQGQSFFQASGDYGAYCGACAPYPPTDSTNITVVGGTSLTTSAPGGAWLSETVWNAGRQPNGTYVGSGGGSSTNYAIPNWQQGVDMTCNGGSTAMRNLPDVACVAAGIWLIADHGEQGVIGGTSAAAPLWAGFAALINQQAAASGQPSVGFINPAIYAIGKSSSYALVFHDITTGNTTNGCCGPNKFFACPGYDLCTGWGTPNGSNLISALLVPPVPLSITPATPLAFTGPFGGPFRPAAQGFVLTNDGNAPLSWTLANTAPWLSVSPASGMLTNGGPAATVAVTLTGAASSLAVGNYAATLWFTNLNNRLGQSGTVNLDIVAPPVITSQPTNQTVFEGMTASFTVGVANSAWVSYQWQYDNGLYVTNLTDGGNVSGSAASTLVISNATPAEAGAYSVIVSNAAGAVVSTEAFLAVFPWRPVITVEPSSQTVLAGETVTFTVTAVGNQPLFYLWEQNGTNLSDGGNISGSASSSLTLASASLADAGTYSVVVGNADGVAASSGAVLTVTSVTAPGTTLSTVYSFTGGSDGGNPNGLLRVANGSFYGTAQHGGTNLAGTVFQMTDGGAVTGLYSFTGGNDGATPFAALAQGPDGNFYGTTFQGGAYDNGTVFRVTASGVLTNLISLNITNGDLPYAGLTLGSDLNFYGTTYQGGAAGFGTAFRISTNGTLTTLYSFSAGSDGGFPAAGLLRGSDGNLYGTTYQVGAYGYGTVFQITASGALTTLTTLASFNNTNGAFPLAGLAQAGGTFCGTTTGGGAFNNGAVFQWSLVGALTDLYSFTGGSDGSYPMAPLLEGSDGNFYGTTAYGGTYGDGTVFRLTPGGSLTTLVAFDGYAGANPEAALIEDADGSLLGTTQNGGASDEGVIFRLSFSGAPQITSQPASQSVYVGADVVLGVAVFGTSPFSFQWQKNGTNLVDGGNLSGSAARLLTLGNVSLADSGTYSVIVSNALGLARSADAVLSVTSSPPFITVQPTNQSPAPGATVTFAVTAFGNLPLFYQWQENGTNLADGGNLSGSATSTLTLFNVLETNSGTYAVIVSNALASVTSTGAVLTVIPVSAPGTRLATLVGFGPASGGGLTPNGLMLATNGDLYGTTQYGQAGNPLGLGTAFRMTTNGILTTLVSFAGTNGVGPQAALVQGSDGNLYGTTEYGGTNWVGNVFQMTPEGALSNLYSFAGGVDGRFPVAPLLSASDGNLYGTTPTGGTYGYGNIFKLTLAGAFTNLYSFTGGLDGNGPTGALMQGADGNFYGLTPYGGAYGKGNAFRLTPGGVLTTIYSFTGGRDGYTPAGALVQGLDGNFYGTTTLGGLGSPGTAFKLTPNGALTTLHSFGNYLNPDGLYPQAGLVQSIDGNLYGTTLSDLLTGYGTVFGVSPNGSTFATFVFFDGFDDGAQPAAALVEDTDGNLYGTTTTNGPGGQGTIFRLSFTGPPQITAQPASQAVLGGANVLFNPAVSGARQFFYQWQKNGTNLVDGGNLSGSTNRILSLANVSLADAGTYSVLVSNALGSVTSAAAHLTVVFPPVFLSVVRSNCTLSLTWSAAVGQEYRLQYKSSLASTNWSYLGGLMGSLITATGSAVTASDNLCTNAQKFYRVVLYPQVQ
ncbi:MAG: choice-of-anchor tandem repeat GloVer-containing protein [Verrucomicrobiota bacterium]